MAKRKDIRALVVGVLALYSNNPSSNTAEVYNFSVEM